MNQFLVVGYGNLLRGDDGLGPFIAEQLADVREPCGGSLRIASLPQLDITLIPQLRDVDTALFIDARQDGDDDPVKVDCIEARHEPFAAGHTSHATGPAALVSMVQAWYGWHPDCYLVMPKGFDFSVGAPISPQGRQNAAQAVAVIARIIAAA